MRVWCRWCVFFLPRHDRICPSYRTSGKMFLRRWVRQFFQMTTMVPIEPEMMMMMMATKDGRTGKRW